MNDGSGLEKTIGSLFKSLPKIPENGKKGLVKFIPWISLVAGLLTLWGAWAIWQWAHVANSLINYANSISAIYGGPVVATTRMSVSIWLLFVIYLVEGLLLVAAFPGTNAHKKSGWNLLFYASLVNVAYGVVAVFTSYGGIGSLIFSLIGSAIAFYLLFQIRSYYMGAKSAPKMPPANPTDNTPKS